MFTRQDLSDIEGWLLIELGRRITCEFPLPEEKSGVILFLGTNARLTYLPAENTQFEMKVYILKFDKGEEDKEINFAKLYNALQFIRDWLKSK